MGSSARRPRRRGRAAFIAVAACAVAAASPSAAADGDAGVALSLLPGGLSLSAPPAVELPPVRLVGAPVEVEAPVTGMTVGDTRSSRPGWTVVASATPMADALGRPIGAALVLVPPATPAGITPGAGGELTEPRAVASAPPGVGGAVSLVPGLRLRVPAEAPTGRYTAVLTLTAT